MRRQVFQRSKLTGLAVAVSLLVVGCTAPAQVAEPPAVEIPAVSEPETTEADEVAEYDTEADEPEYEEYEPEAEEPIVLLQPLTGVVVDHLEDRPIIGVKIENTGPARPQIGLEFADQVWEIVVEGGITRFIALYQSNYPTAVGPVRSARTSDIGVMTPLSAVLAFSGGYGPAIARIQQYGIQTMAEGRNSGFRRTPDRRAPHNVIGNVEAFAEQARYDRSLQYPQGLWSTGIEDSSAYQTGTDVSRISVRVSPGQTTNWDWDAASGTFLRSDGQRASVSNTGVRHAATNVMVAVMAQGTFAGVPETQMLGSGPALIATGGRAIEGTWEKETMYRPLRFFDTEGHEVKLAPGQTWYMLSTANSNNWTLTP